jgi:hypothetical protein
LKQRTRQQILFLIVIVVVIALLFKRFHQAAGPQHPAPAPEAISCGVHCGTERWAVKTLSDASAAGVNLAATPVTVDWLVSQAQPAVLPEDQRISPVEDHAYVVNARLVGFKLEDDEDIHIVIADLNNPAETMIVEIPSSDCSGACFSTHLAEFVQARTGGKLLRGDIQHGMQFDSIGSDARLMVQKIEEAHAGDGHRHIAGNSFESFVRRSEARFEIRARLHKLRDVRGKARAAAIAGRNFDDHGFRGII